MKTIAVLLASLSAIFVFQAQIYAQTEILQTKIITTTDRTIDVFKSKDSRTFIQVFENNEGSVVIDEGPKAGLEYEKIVSGLIIDGIKYTFLPNETYFFHKDGHVFTIYLNWKTYRKVLKKYDLSSELQFEKELTIGSIESGIHLNQNKSIIVVDNLSEGYGTDFKIINTNFEILNEFKPFDSGFKYSDISSDSLNFIIITESENAQTIFNVAFFDNLNGLEIFNYNLSLDNESKIITSNIAGENTLIVVNNSSWVKRSKLISVNKLGNIQWEFNYPNFTYNPFIFSKNTSVIINCIDQLICLNLNTGNEEWKFNFENYYQDFISNNRMKVITIEHKLLLNNQLISIFFGEINKNKGLPDGYTNQKIFFLNWNGELVDTFFLTKDISKDCGLFDIDQNHFALFNNKKLYYYEEKR
ncbi:MAG: hypothetical protein R2764_21365 [Bacteroidales bacterium]